MRTKLSIYSGTMTPNQLIQATALPPVTVASHGKVSVGGRASPDRGRWAAEMQA